MEYFFTALALVFVLEGVLPFLSPNLWRRMTMRMVGQNDRVMRLFGFGSMMVGLIILYVIHH